MKRFLSLCLRRAVSATCCVLLLCVSVSAGGAEGAFALRRLSYEGYTLRWEDDFTAERLNEADWNIELHEPGWVNEEWQAYVDDPQNLFLRDGQLVIKARRDDGGNVTSARINTKGKHDFVYGLIEARVKVPAGQGYLPAFWMLPTDESLYGGWVRCGEIDIMEVLGQQTGTAYGSLHYGDPQAQSQGTIAFPENSFSNDFHTFSLEWEPGSIRWYVDGLLFHQEDNWYCAQENQGQVAYPAPFDQPFYLILNLAVGGSWVGYPEDGAAIDGEYCVDYVRVYQKDAYGQAALPAGYEDRSGLTGQPRGMLADGNYVYNGKFQEGLDRMAYWSFINLSGAKIEVTNEDPRDRRLKITAPEKTSVSNPVLIIQDDLGISPSTAYHLSYTVQGDIGTTLRATLAGRPMDTWLTGERQTVESTVTSSDPAYNRVIFTITEPGTYYLDDVVVEEDCLILNGKFMAGLNHFSPYVDLAAQADFSAAEQGSPACLISIDGAGKNQWDIQLKQENVFLEYGKRYRLTIDMQSTLPRMVTVALLRDGSQRENDWTPYMQREALIDPDMKTYAFEFVMRPTTLPLTDFSAVFAVALGAPEGQEISQPHTVTLANITLEKVTAELTR